MTVTEVLQLLEDNKNERGIRYWEKMGETNTRGLKSFGIGLTQLRKLAKKVGRDHDLAMSLWESDVYDARVMAMLVDEPGKITRNQAERQVEELQAGMLAHVFASCDATLAKTPFAVELADEWIHSRDPMRRSCGYGLLYEASKFSGKKAPGETWFADHIDHINRTIDDESSGIRLAMGTALMGIGKRNARLNEDALAVAERVGPIEFESFSGNCDPFEPAKHLKADRLKQKFAAVVG